MVLSKSEYDRNRYVNNPEYFKTKNSNYWVNNKTKLQLYFKEYRKNNMDKKLQQSIKYLQNIGIKIDRTVMEVKVALKAWSNLVKKLDNFMCKNCDSIEKLQSHHIYPLYEYPEKAFDLDNGVTLCVKCHRKSHGDTW